MVLHWSSLGSPFGSHFGGSSWSFIGILRLLGGSLWFLWALLRVFLGDLLGLFLELLLVAPVVLFRVLGSFLCFWCFVGILRLLLELLLGFFGSPFGVLLGAHLVLHCSSLGSPLVALPGALLGSQGSFAALCSLLLGLFSELLLGARFGLSWGSFKAGEMLSHKECQVLISFSNSLPAKCSIVGLYAPEPLSAPLSWRSGASCSQFSV